MGDLFQQFRNLIDPSTTLGAFLISIAASFVVSFISGFFVAKKVTNVQKAKIVIGDMNQDSTVIKREI